MTSPLLQVKELTTELTQEGKVYKVVDKLSFKLMQGKTLALVGESGCGKSMSAFSIMRILPQPPCLPPRGEVLYKGVNLLQLPNSGMREIRGAKIAIIFQDPRRGFNPVYTVGDQIKEVVETHLGFFGKEAEKIVIEALHDVSLPNPTERMREYPHQMSGGMLQRAMIAMAIVAKPDILIADEPTTALDVTIQAEILSMLRALQKKKGMAILLITHDMGVVAEMADDVIVMYATEKVEESSVDKLFDNPSHPYTAALFASRMGSCSAKGKLPAIKGSVPSITQLPQGCHFSPRCPYAFAPCFVHNPPLLPVQEEGHSAKCWLFSKDVP